MRNYQPKTTNLPKSCFKWSLTNWRKATYHTCTVAAGVTPGLKAQ